MTVKLHVFPLSPRAFKVLFAAHQIGVDYEIAFCDLTTGAQKTPAFTALNPNQRMPVLEHDGFVVWESNAIVTYLAELKPESGYLPKELRDRTTALKWMFWESNHWDPACAVFMFENVVKPALRGQAADPAEIERGHGLFARLAPVLDGQLARSRYVAGERITVADLSLASTLASAEQAQMPVAEYRGINRWMAEMRGLPAWAKTAALQKPPG